MLGHIAQKVRKTSGPTCLLPAIDGERFLRALQTRQREYAGESDHMYNHQNTWGRCTSTSASSQLEVTWGSDQSIGMRSASVLKLLTIALNRRNCFIVDSITSFLLLSKDCEAPSDHFQLPF